MSKPIGYACWTPILVHLDANIRVQISLHCPQLQTLNRLCPTKIKKLVIELPRLEIDGVTYSPEIARDRKTTDKAYTKIQNSKEEVKKLEKSLESSDDKQAVEERIDLLQSFIKALERQRKFRRPDLVFQITAYGKNQEITILGTAEMKFKSIFDVEGYLLRKLLCGNNHIDVAVLNPNYDMNCLEDSWDISLIANAKHLSLNKQTEIESFVALPNSNVYCDNYEFIYRDSSKQLSEMLVADWQKRNYPVGRKYRWCLTYEPNARELFDHISSLPGSRTGTIAKTRETDFPLAVTFHMSAETELNVYCVTEYIQQYKFTEFYFFFEVHPKGYATHF